MDRHRIGIVIPALNEESTIGALVRRAAAHGTPIVVNDGSTDATGERASAEGATVVRHETPRGYDGALEAGFSKANELGCEFVITMDADGQHDPAIIDRFVSALDGGADVVIGNRDRRQRIGEQIFAWVGSAVWGIRDPLCGMKGYRMTLYKELGHFDSFQSIGTELAVYAARTSKKIVQFDVKTNDRADPPRFGRRYSANKRILIALYRCLRGVGSPK